jgi:lipopolysaccharide transport system ATP-binding protein
MDKNTAILVENLGKQYHIREKRVGYYTIRDTIVNVVKSPFQRMQAVLSGNAGSAMEAKSKFWALKNLSFEMKQGEALGIIGHNGAGKSTLLKILSGITDPSEGQALIRGRVGALLEVGTGFHPELSGRENIYLNGAILGMTRQEIEAKFDEIVSFAEVERFIETPVKHYSSGMRLRLGFAVAAHLEPEILVVDEVLAVGDAKFQKKSLGRMTNIAHEGRTVLFVSHNMSAVQNMCTRVIWLQNGQIVMDGAPAEVVAQYLKTSIETKTEQVWEDIETAPGNDKVRLRRAAVGPLTPNELNIIDMRTPIKIEIELWNKVEGAYLDVRLDIYNQEGILIFATGSITDRNWHDKPMPSGQYRYTCYIPGDLLNAGTHRVTAATVHLSTIPVFRYDELISFEVLDSAEVRSGWYGKQPGAVKPLLDWTTEYLDLVPFDAERS